MQDGAPGDALAIVAAHSIDGGATWTQNVPPAQTICNGGSSLRIIDPRLAVDGDGVTFLSECAGIPDPLGAVAVSRSLDNGATWSRPKTLIPSAQCDYPTMSPDPTNPHAISITWSERGVDSTWFARTTDDGATFAAATPIRVTPAGRLSLNSLATLPDGTLIDIAEDLGAGPAFGLPDVGGMGLLVTALRSTDHGMSWKETRIAKLSDQGTVSDPAVGPDGAVNLLFSDLKNGARTWQLVRSTNGAAWSQVATVPLPADAFVVRTSRLPRTASLGSCMTIIATTRPEMGK